MPFSDPRRHFQDVLTAIEKIEEFVGTIEFEDYAADDKTKAAVERKLQILTEAIIRIDDESPGAYPEIDQKGYRGMGNILRHSYHKVDDKIVWETIQRVVLEILLSKPGSFA